MHQSNTEATRLMTEKDVWSLDELSRMDIEFEPLVEGLLGPNETLMLVGMGGVGKSLLVLNAAFQLAGGSTRLWGKYVIPKPLNVLIVQAELGAPAMKLRVDKMIKSYPKSARSAKVLVAAEASDCRLVGDMAVEGFRWKIERLLEEYEIDVLIVDPLVCYHTNDENDNNKMRRVLDEIGLLCSKRKNTACIIVHHVGKWTENKTIAGRGASAIFDFAANVISLKRETSGAIAFEHKKARNFPRHGTFSGRFDENLVFRMNAGEGANIASGEDAKAAMLALKEEFSGRVESVAELANYLDANTQKGKSTWTTVIKKLGEEGVFSIENNGSGVRNAVTLNLADLPNILSGKA